MAIVANTYNMKTIPTGRDFHLSLQTEGATAVNEVQRITITGGPAGGDFTIEYDGQETAAIVYNATPTQVKNALELLSNIDQVACTGGNLPGTPIDVEFQTTLAATDVELMIADGSGLTGGSSPDAAITEQIKGVSGAEVILAAESGFSHYITKLVIRSDAAMDVSIGSGGDAGTAMTTVHFGPVPLAAGSGFFEWEAPRGMGIKCTSGLSLAIESTATGTMWIEAHGKTCKD